MPEHAVAAVLERAAAVGLSTLLWLCLSMLLRLWLGMLLWLCLSMLLRLGLSVLLRQGLSMLLRLGLSVLLRQGLSVLLRLGLSVLLRLGLSTLLRLGLSTLLRLGLSMLLRLGLWSSARRNDGSDRSAYRNRLCRRKNGRAPSVRPRQTAGGSVLLRAGAVTGCSSGEFAARALRRFPPAKALE